MGGYFHMRVMSSTRMPKELVIAAEAEASRHGCSVSFRPGSKHPWIMDVVRGALRRSVSLSLNSEFQINWIKQDVRRLARQIS
jgi:hypothetical protein